MLNEYFTFYRGQESLTGLKLHGCYVKVTSMDSLSAKEVFINEFMVRCMPIPMVWDTQYSEELFHLELLKGNDLRQLVHFNDPRLVKHY